MEETGVARIVNDYISALNADIRDRLAIQGQTGFPSLAEAEEKASLAHRALHPGAYRQEMLPPNTTRDGRSNYRYSAASRTNLEPSGLNRH